MKNRITIAVLSLSFVAVGALGYFGTRAKAQPAIPDHMPVEKALKLSRDLAIVAAENNKMQPVYNRIDEVCAAFQINVGELSGMPGVRQPRVAVDDDGKITRAGDVAQASAPPPAAAPPPPKTAKK